MLKRLRRLSRLLNRKQDGWQNRKKANVNLARLHARISNISNDAPHQLTTNLVLLCSMIFDLSGLKVLGMDLEQNRAACQPLLVAAAGYHNHPEL